jgi:hypothetical protein
LPVQTAYPALHVGTHAPDVHVVDPFGFVHAVPQVPQLVALVLRLIWQPWFGLPPQTAYPALHDGVHAPPVHEVVPFGFVHVVPQVPQLPVLVLRLIWQPRLGLPPQTA